MEQQNTQQTQPRVSASPQSHVQYAVAHGQPAFQAPAVGQPPGAIPSGGYPAPQVPAMAYPHRHHQLQLFWKNQMQEIERVNDFKNHQLPLARIKKIMKADEDVRMISAEAPVVFAKACEMFILELTLRSWINTEENKRRTLQKNDIGAAISCTDIYDFLVDIVPRDELKDEGVGVPHMNLPVGAPAEAFPYGGMYYMPPGSVPPMPGAQSAGNMMGSPGITVGRPAMPVDPGMYMPQQLPYIAHPPAQQLPQQQQQHSIDTSSTNPTESSQQAKDGEPN